MDSEHELIETAVLTRLLDRIESLDRKVDQLTAVIEQASHIADLIESDEIKNLLNSGIIAPEAVGVVSSAADALVASRNQSTPQVGMFGLLKALRDSDLQRALGFLVLFGKEFGKNLSTAF
jgi:uncharacterized protein YjgD (DUF1641 family)